MFRGCLDGKEDVAVKFLHSHRLEHRDLQAFLTEVAILHTCRHECIVELKGAFLSEVRTCQLMSRVPCMSGQLVGQGLHAPAGEAGRAAPPLRACWRPKAWAPIATARQGRPWSEQPAMIGGAKTAV